MLAPSTMSHVAVWRSSTAHSYIQETWVASATQTPAICRGFLFAAPRGCGSSANPLPDLQEQRDKLALAMGVRLGKDGFQMIACRLPGNFQFAGGDIGRGAARDDTGELGFGRRRRTFWRGSPRVSMAETKCAKWRRESVPVGPLQCLSLLKNLSGLGIGLPIRP